MELLGAIVSIVVINIVLSGDNAVVIGMTAHRLPRAQRRWAILAGSGGATVVRVVLTAVAAILLAVPFLNLVGGALLLWIGFRLLDEDRCDIRRPPSCPPLKDYESTSRCPATLRIGRAGSRMALA